MGDQQSLCCGQRTDCVPQLCMLLYEVLIPRLPISHIPLPSHPHTSHLIPSHPHTLIPSHPHALIPSHPHTLISSHPHTLTSSHPLPSHPHTLIPSHPHALTSSYPHILIPSRGHPYWEGSMFCTQHFLRMGTRNTRCRVCGMSVMMTLVVSWDGTGGVVG